MRLLVVGVVGLAVAGSLFAAAFVIRGSRTEVRVAESRALASTAIALSRDRPETALLLAVEALRLVRDASTDETYEARNALVLSSQRFARVRAILRGHRGPVLAVAFSPDGTLLASAGVGGAIRIWDVRRHLGVGRLVGHRQRVQALAWSPDGRTLASADDDGLIRVWDARRLTQTGVLSGHRERVLLLAFSADGKWLASGQQYSQVRLWDVRRLRQSGATLRISPIAMQFDPTGRLLVASTVGLITRHRVPSPRPYVEPPFDTGWTEYFHGAFTDTGRWLLIDGEAPLALWRVTRTRISRRDVAGVVHARSVAAGRRRLVHGHAGGRVRVSAPEPAYWEPVDVRFHNGAATAVDLSRDGATVAVGGADGTVRLGWSGQVPPLSRPIGVRRVISGSQVDSIDGTRTAQITRPDDPDRASTVVVRNEHGRRVGPQLETQGTLAAFLPDRRRIALVGSDRTMRFWDVERGEVTEVFPRGFPRPEARLLAFNSDGTVLAAASERDVRLWDVRRSAPLGDPIGTADTFPARLRFDPGRNGFVLASALVQACCPVEFRSATEALIDPLLVSSDYERWRARVCELVSRDLSRNEWRLYVPSRPYRRTCTGG